MSNPQRENGFTAISNEIMEALARIRIAGEARQMLDVIIRKTYGFNKKKDTIISSQFKELTGLSNMAIHKAREKLTNMNLITITKKGNSQGLTYSFQKDYDKWKPLPKKVTVTKKGNNCYPKRLRTVTKKVYNIQKKKETIQKKEKHHLLTNQFFKDTWDAWLEVRTKIRAPNTEKALELHLKDLEKYPLEIAIKMLEQSISRGWRGVFPLKEQKQEGRKP